MIPACGEKSQAIFMPGMNPMNNIERKTLQFDLKASSADGGTFEGYANAFHNIDSAQEIVVPGAFTDTLPQFLEDGFIGGINHQWDMPIGKPTGAKEDVLGLFIQAMISDTVSGRDCRTLMKDRVIKKMSIGYRVKADEWLETADEVAAYWKQHSYQPTAQDIARSQYGVRLLHKINPLFECSPVTVPANDRADISRVKQFDLSEIKTERQFEKLLREALGFSRNDAETICMKGFRALHQREVEETPTEPTPPTEEPEAKTQEEPTQVPPVAVVKASQAEVRALYATFLNNQARRYAPH